MIDSVFRVDKNHYSQAYLEECNKHFVKEKRISNYITDYINIYFDDSDREDSDYSVKKILMIKYKKLLLIEIRADFFILCLSLKSSLISAVILHYEKKF